MPQSEATRKWCDEARRLVKLAASERAAAERALEKAQLDRHKELADRFAGRLTFGTAGLRGPLRAGVFGMTSMWPSQRGMMSMKARDSASS